MGARLSCRGGVDVSGVQFRVQVPASGSQASTAAFQDRGLALRLFQTNLIT